MEDLNRKQTDADHREDNQEVIKGNPDNLFYNYNRELFYSFDKSKGFTKKVDYQYTANQTIIKQQWDLAEVRLNEVKRLVIAGKRSPIAYYMEKKLMDVPILAAYMNHSTWKIRWHLTNAGFKWMKQVTLERYAKIFEISPEELRKPSFLTNFSEN